MKNEVFIEYDELTDLEQFIRWYYDMDINVEGIDALQNMLSKVKQLQKEIEQLKYELSFYKSLL